MQDVHGNSSFCRTEFFKELPALKSVDQEFKNGVEQGEELPHSGSELAGGTITVSTSDCPTEKSV